MSWHCKLCGINIYRLAPYSGSCSGCGCQYLYLSSAFGGVLTCFQMFGNTPGSSPFCGKSITISYGGKSTGAVIVDKVSFLSHSIYQLLVLSITSQCPGCPPGGLDLTQGLFQFFASLGTGVIYGEWSVGGGAPAKAPPASSPPPPSPTTHYDPPTTYQQSTSSPPPPTTSSSTSTSTTPKTSSSVSSAPPTTTQQSSSTSSASQTSGANYNNPPASSLAQPTGTVSPGQNEAINNIYQAMIGMGSIVAFDNP